jgi:hypothetical protein
MFKCSISDDYQGRCLKLAARAKDERAVFPPFPPPVSAESWPRPETITAGSFFILISRESGTWADQVRRLALAHSIPGKLCSQRWRVRPWQRAVLGARMPEAAATSTATFNRREHDVNGQLEMLQWPAVQHVTEFTPMVSTPKQQLGPSVLFALCNEACTRRLRRRTRM